MGPQVSMPYDALALLRILDPEAHFTPEAVAGKHSLCGAVENVHNLRDVAATRKTLVAAIGDAVGLIVAGGLAAGLVGGLECQLTPVT